MPWLSEEVDGWESMTEDEREPFRRAIEDLGMWIDLEGDNGEPGDYYE